MVDLNFNAGDVDPAEEWTLLPVDRYTAIITDSEDVQNKSGSGSHLKLTFSIVEGKYTGRRQWARLNLNNDSEYAVDIARAELSAICHAVGVMQMNDTAELHNRPLVISVKHETKANFNNGEPTAKVAGFYSVADNKAAAKKKAAPKPAADDDVMDGEEAPF